MPRWSSRILARVHLLAAEGRVLMTRKAVQELEDLDVSLQQEDVGEVLLALRPEEAVERLRSEHDGAWLYVFRVEVEGLAVYLKFAVYEDCVVISFHEYE